MPRMTTLANARATANFAEKAGRWLAANPQGTSFTLSGELIPGELLALRWGLTGRCVVVLTIDEDAEVVNFQDAVPSLGESNA